MSITLWKIQDEHKVWADYNFGRREPWQAILGALEELGEISHAYLKLSQGIRGNKQDLTMAMMDGIGDTAIFLIDLCNSMGFDFETVLRNTWSEVKERDWKADPSGDGY